MKQQELFNQSYEVHIMPLLFMASGVGTHTHTHARTHTHLHESDFTKPGVWPACANLKILDIETFLCWSQQLSTCAYPWVSIHRIIIIGSIYSISN